MSLIANLRESHYYHIPSQGNIYTVAHLEVVASPPKILVATLKRDIFCIEYQELSEGLLPTTKEVSFTYIPSGAEIISIDAFNKSETKNEFVIGIAIIKSGNAMDTFEYYLNIYSEWEENMDFNIDNIAQNCLNVELNFVPYQLTHTELVMWADDQIIKKEIVFLLAGSDGQVHIYREHSDHLYKEIENKSYFPEFLKTPSPATWIDVYLSEDKVERFTAVGCECGFVRFTKVCVKTNRLIFNFSTKMHNFISQVRLHCSARMAKKFDLKAKNAESCKFDLLVVNTLLSPVLFIDILTYGLSNYVSLPRHDYTCILSCCQIADIDFDGENEILIGNSSEELMVYKRNESKGWCLEELKTFSSPILSMKYIDIIEDGINELVVLTIKGIHILQHDSSYIDKILSDKIKQIEFYYLFFIIVNPGTDKTHFCGSIIA